MKHPEELTDYDRALHHMAMKKGGYYQKMRLCDSVWKGRKKAKCFYCGVITYRTGKLPRGNIDHVIARSKGGTNSAVNLVIACVECNSRKSDRGALTFIFELSALLYRENQ